MDGKTKELVQHGLTGDQVELLKRTVAPGLTDDELALFLHTARSCGLDPLKRQVHAVKRHSKKGPATMSIQIGIDGYRLIADRTGAYAGNADPVYVDGKNGFPISATVTVYKLVAGIRCPFTATARWAEYSQSFKGDDGKWHLGNMWEKMPHVMLGKCAETLALRKAFPAELAGTYSDEEMQQADGFVEAEERTLPPKALSPPPAPLPAPPPAPEFDIKKALRDFGVPDSDMEYALALVTEDGKDLLLVRAELANMYKENIRWDSSAPGFAKIDEDALIEELFMDLGVPTGKFAVARGYLDSAKPLAGLRRLKKSGYRWDDTEEKYRVPKEQ